MHVARGHVCRESARLGYDGKVSTALVLSAGGMYAAWEVGVWKALREHIAIDLVLGASAGAWNGWAIAGGATVDELEREWLDPATGRILQWGPHSAGVLRPDALYRKSRELYARFRPRIPFGLTVVEVPRLQVRLVRDSEIEWQHLAASCTIPFCFPPVRMGDAGNLACQVYGVFQRTELIRHAPLECLRTAEGPAIGDGLDIGGNLGGVYLLRLDIAVLSPQVADRLRPPRQPPCPGTLDKHPLPS